MALLELAVSKKIILKHCYYKLTVKIEKSLKIGTLLKFDHSDLNGHFSNLKIYNQTLILYLNYFVNNYKLSIYLNLNFIK